MKTTLALIPFAALLAITAPAQAQEHAQEHTQQAHGEHEPSFADAPVVHPSTHYSGSSAIDLSHGLSFNNGTFGLRNPDYEKWAQGPYLAVGISDKTYPYSNKDSFVTGMADRIAFFETAMANWDQTTPDTKPEAIEYAKNAKQTIGPRLDKVKDAYKSAKSAGSGSWDNAQAEARRALADLLGAYYQLHKNVANK